MYSTPPSQFAVSEEIAPNPSHCESQSATTEMKWAQGPYHELAKAQSAPAVRQWAQGPPNSPNHELCQAQSAPAVRQWAQGPPH